MPLGSAIRVSAVAGFGVMLAAAQAQQPAARVEFEVVSVKPGDPFDPGSSGRMPPGRLEMRNATLATLVRNAYQLNEFQLVGGPKWMGSARFNIDAKLPQGAPGAQVPLMIQAMLADRFKLEFHRETKVISEYALVVAKGGPNLQAPAGDEKRKGATSQGPRQIKAWGAPVSTLARMLISAVGAPVLDRTSLEGQYDFVLEFAPLQGAAEDEKLPSIFAALQQIGLKLE